MEALPVIVTFAFAFALGAMVGSFLNVVIYRVPRGMSVARPARSFCPTCQRSIPWYLNIPLISWIALNGRCAGCKSVIPVRYVLVEAAGATLFALLAWLRLGALDQIGGADVLQLVVLLCAAALVLAIAVIDFQHAIIPDPLTIPWIPLFVGCVALFPALLQGHALDVSQHGADRLGLAAALAGIAICSYPALFIDFVRRDRGDGLDDAGEPESALPTDDERFEALAELRLFLMPVLLPSLIGAVVAVFLLAKVDVAAHSHMAAAVASAAGAGFGLTFIYVVRFVFSVAFGREAMGLGDAKFLALAGALLGADGCVVVFVLSSLLGAIPAFASLLRRIPIATIGLLLGALLPLALLEPVAEVTGPRVALVLLLPVPLLALLLFLRRLRRSDAPMTAMPFGPFLAVATLILLLFWQPITGLPVLRAIAGP